MPVEILESQAAGSGKTEAVVLDPLQHIEDGNYEAITFRRSTKSLKGAGGIFNKAGKIYNRIGAKVNSTEMKYTFPSGATCRYSHLEHGVATAEQDHAGLEYSSITFEELHTFDRESFFFMLTRLRSNANVPSKVKATMNPCTRESQGGWIHEFLEGFYIDDYGYPIQENSGKIRYFVSDEDGHIDMADTEGELLARHGNDCSPMSFSFISALIVDNPVLCKLQPDYLRALRNAGRVERERLLFGCWNVAPKGGGYFQRDWVDFIDRRDLPKLTKAIRCWDLASSVKSEVNSDPDATASVLMGTDSNGRIYIIDACDLFGRPAQVSDKILERGIMDGKATPIGIPQDVGAAGVVAFSHYANPLMQRGFKVKRMKARKGKLERFQGFSNAAENGMVTIVRGDWNRKFMSQLEDFDPQRKRGHDD